MGTGEGRRRARPGAGIRVSRERLQPLGAMGAFFGVGLLAFAVIPLWIMYSARELASGILVHPKVVLLAHLYALGWGGFVALGALRQLAPVVFQAEVRPPSGSQRAGFAGLAGGFVLFAAGIASRRYAIAALGGALMTAAFVLNFALVAASARAKQRRSVIEWFAAPAALSLVLTGAVGTLAALDRTAGVLRGAWSMALASHLYLGPLGFYGLLVLGVTYELAPFFGLTRSGDDKGLGRYDRTVLLLLLAGLAAGWGTFLVGASRPAFLLPVAAALVLFVVDLRGIFGRRDPMRRTATLAGVRASHSYLLVVAAMIAAGAIAPGLWSRAAWIRAFAWLITAGWLSNAITGYLHRILPFVAWHNRYWGKPKEEIRTRFQDMVSQRLGKWGVYIYNAGVIAVLASFESAATLAFASGLLAAGSWILVYNLARVFFR